LIWLDRICPRLQKTAATYVHSLCSIGVASCPRGLRLIDASAVDGLIAMDNKDDGQFDGIGFTAQNYFRKTLKNVDLIISKNIFLNKNEDISIWGCFKKCQPVKKLNRHILSRSERRLV
jgi:hypothetical protein